MSKQHKTVAAVAKKPMGLLRARLSGDEVRIPQTGLPDAVFVLKALDSTQMAYMLDIAANRMGGDGFWMNAKLLTVKFSVVAVRDLYDEDGKPAPVAMEEIQVGEDKYTCLPDSFLKMLPMPVVSLLDERANRIAALGYEEKKGLSFSGGSESAESPVTEPPSGSSEESSPAPSAGLELST